MKQTMTMSTAQASLNDLPKKLARPSKRAGVKVTQKGKPVLAILDWEYFESLLETLEILGDEEQMKAFREGIKEGEEGKEISWEDAKRDLF